MTNWCQSLSRPRHHCKTTTTLDIFFPVVFISLILFFDWGGLDGDGFIVFWGFCVILWGHYIHFGSFFHFVSPSHPYCKQYLFGLKWDKWWAGRWGCLEGFSQDFHVAASEKGLGEKAFIRRISPQSSRDILKKNTPFSVSSIMQQQDHQWRKNKNRVRTSTGSVPKLTLT